MRRDMEIIRKLLAAIEAKSDLEPNEIKIQDADDLVVGRHVEILFAAGMIDGFESDQLGLPYTPISVRDLTWEGHDLAASLRNESVWASIKKKLSPDELSTLPLPVIKTVATALIQQWAMSKLGLSAG